MLCGPISTVLNSDANPQQHRTQPAIISHRSANGIKRVLPSLNHPPGVFIMTQLPAPVTAKAPVPLLQRQIKADLRNVFKGLGKAMIDFFAGNSPAAGKEVLGVLVDSGLKTGNDELAFALIQQALARAGEELARESQSYLPDEIEPAKCERLSEALEAQLVNITIDLTNDFFLHPQTMPFLANVQPCYAQWLCDIGVAPPTASVIAARLPSYFVVALAAEWRGNQARYKPLLEALHTPFDAALTREREWQDYGALLEKQIHENIFDEPFGIAQIYVPLWAWYEKKSGQQNCGVDERLHGREEREKVRVAVDIGEELDRWVKAWDKDDAIRIISGGPGSGKSSFTKIYCAHLFWRGLAKPIFIPLHLIEADGEPEHEVERFFNNAGIFTHQPLAAQIGTQKMMLVFDGLDELSSQGKLATQTARNFVMNVERFVAQRNLGAAPIMVLFSGRELVVQESEAQFQRERQILYLLPYYIDEREVAGLKNGEAFRGKNLRDAWWQNYGRLINQAFSCAPKEFKAGQLCEITAQPLLNYLIALSLRRGKIVLSAKTDLNAIYGDLVSAVYERAYERKRQHKVLQRIKEQDFFRVLEEIGMASWQSGDGRSTTVNAIQARCEQSGMGPLLERFAEGAKAGVTNLLAAFFFRKSGYASTGDEQFIFTHKSFGEYLAARRLCRAAAKLVEQLARREECYEDGISMADGLKNWFKLAGSAMITRYIRDFLRNEIRNQRPEEIKKWIQYLTPLMEQVIDFQVPLSDKAQTVAGCRNEFGHGATALFLVLNICAELQKQRLQYKFRESTSFGTFIRAICPQRSGGQNHIIYDHFSYLGLQNQIVHFFDFYDANLYCSDFSRSQMNYVVLMNANLSDANLSRANLSDANLSRANLSRADLSGANLSRSNLSRSNLSGADLSGADLSGADLSRADLIGANLIDADLSEEQRKQARHA
jgi:Pentapeptide repeats (8 copies)